MKATFSIISIVLLFAACNKAKLESPDQATLTMVYAHTGGLRGILPVFNDGMEKFHNSYRLTYREWDGFAVSGGRSFGVSAQQPTNLKLFFETDTLKSVFEMTMQFQALDNYTLFISGTSRNIDTLMIKENIQQYTDSVTGIRFINLSPDIGEVSVNLQGEAPGAQVPSLAYRQFTGFKTYPAKKENTGYVFEVRKASTGDLLTTFTFNSFATYIPRFKQATLILRGEADGDPALQVVKLNHF